MCSDRVSWLTVRLSPPGWRYTTEKSRIESAGPAMAMHRSVVHPSAQVHSHLRCYEHREPAATAA
jgi:hypothetical protein